MTVDEGALIGTVAARSGLPYGQAVAATHAALRTLAERISPRTAAALSRKLPRAVENSFRVAEPGHALDRREFVWRVSGREGVTAAAAEPHARAVLTTMRELVGDEFEEVLRELPDGLRDLARTGDAPKRRGQPGIKDRVAGSGGELSSLTYSVGERAEVITLRGEIDGDTVGLLEERVRNAVEQGRREVVIDLLEVGRIEPDILGSFAQLHELLQGRGGKLVIVCGRPQLRKLFREAHLTETLEISPTAREALSASRRTI